MSGLEVTNKATNTTTRLVTDTGSAYTVVNLIPDSYTIRATQPGFQQIGAAMSVQKELMRHASIQTAMNIYGRAMTETKR